MVQDILTKEDRLQVDPDPEDQWVDAQLGTSVSGDAAIRSAPLEPAPSNTMDTTRSEPSIGSFDSAHEHQAQRLLNVVAEYDTLARLQELVGKLVKASSLQAAEIERLSTAVLKHHPPPRSRPRVQLPPRAGRLARRSEIQR